jgi:hypothetical protein
MRYGTLVKEIENEFLCNQGSSKLAGIYPTMVAEAYGYLCNYKKDTKNLTRLLGHVHTRHCLEPQTREEHMPG